MNMQLFEKIDGLLGISVLALLFVALAASQADARLGEKGALNAENQAVTTATRMTKNEAPGAAQLGDVEVRVRLDGSHAESVVEAVGNLVIDAATRGAD
jgi:hypothetical protein